jgi:CheY-like chemotaxis protein
MMPDMSGDEIAAQLREDPQLSSIKYIFMTAIVSKDETSEMGSDIGGNQFVAKPVRINELIKIIDKNL